ncbi:MAG: acyl-ACP--UDP-N-acetylglucosamine O-acyltransferase [Cytophagales bacterium]|nr:acyl-ACP--UDP-N-acetylglucosamine O-acyltransferase [Cytophagales bacterium]MDW8384600.1 acyl-ACP--UDP-N-acetylglucosamine O-acyltransferase [Flammeovirgaceae bacterium]
MSQYHLSNVHPNAKIASNVVIEPFATIYEDVEIGEGSWIGPNTVIMDGARIGKNCKIFPGSVISGTPQDLKYKGEPTLTYIGDNTVIREYVTISKGTSEQMFTKIGENCLIMAYCHIAHDCNIGNHNIFSNCVQLAGHVHTGDYVTIGGTSAIHQFTHIGDYAFVAGGTRCRQDVPPYVKAAEEPIAYYGINTVGLRRRGFSNEIIFQIKEVYRYLYYKGLNRKMALEAIEAELPDTPERNYILNFIRSSKRGIIGAAVSAEVNTEDD